MYVHECMYTRMSRVMRKKVNTQMNDWGDFSLPSVMYTNMYVMCLHTFYMSELKVKMLKIENIFIYFYLSPGTRVLYMYVLCVLYFF